MVRIAPANTLSVPEGPAAEAAAAVRRRPARQVREPSVPPAGWSFPAWARKAASQISEGREAKGSSERSSLEWPSEGRIVAGQPAEGGLDAARRSQGTRAAGQHSERRPVTGRTEEGRGAQDAVTRIAGEGATGAFDAAFRAGAGLGALDAIMRDKTLAWRGAFANRLALGAATASVTLLGRGEESSALRDAYYLRHPGDDPGPAGRVLGVWRTLAARSPEHFLAMDARSCQRFAEDLGLPNDESLSAMLAGAKSLAVDATPVLAAVAAAAALPRHIRGAGGDRRWSSPFDELRGLRIFGFCLADAVLARRLAWPIVLPLLAGAILHPALRVGPAKKTPRPGDPEWLPACCRATAHAADAAHDLALDLARRAAKLQGALPKLRAKGSEAAVQKLLDEDAVSAAMRPGNLSDRAARRLFGRLVSLGVIRELSGRPNFRLYGL